MNKIKQILRYRDLDIILTATLFAWTFTMVLYFLFLIPGGTILQGPAPTAPAGCAVRLDVLEYGSQDLTVVLSVSEGTEDALVGYLVEYDGGEWYSRTLTEGSRDVLGQFSPACINHSNSTFGTILDAINSGDLPLG